MPWIIPLLYRHIFYDVIFYTDIVKVDFVFFILIAHFFFFTLFLMNTETKKINVIKVIYLFTFIRDTGLNSHANIGNCVEFSIIMWGRPFTLASY